MWVVGETRAGSDRDTVADRREPGDEAVRRDADVVADDAVAFDDGVVPDVTVGPDHRVLADGNITAGLETISDPSSCVDRGPSADPGISSDVYRTHGSAAALAPETDVVVDERALADAHVAGGRIADELTASHEDGPHCAARGRMAIVTATQA